MPDAEISGDISQHWLSAHLHVPGQRAGLHGEAADAAALEIIAPFVAKCRDNGWIRRYFFIRYRENGAHLRFRLAGDATVLRETVRPSLIDFVRVASPGVLFDEEDPSPGLAPLPVVRLRWVPYVPETARFGGLQALPIAEHFFCMSSDVALALLSRIRGRPIQLRLGQSLLAMLVMAHAVITNAATASVFFDDYRHEHLRTRIAIDPETRDSLQRKFDEGVARQSHTLGGYVQETWRRLADEEVVSAPIDSLTQAARQMANSISELASRQQQSRYKQGVLATELHLRRIMASQMHMMNNRLGIRLDEEAYLAHVCAKGLRRSGHMT